MPRIAYGTPDDINERRVDRLKYREDVDCRWFYVDETLDTDPEALTL